MKDPRRHDPYQAWRFRDFRLFLAGSILASIGQEMRTVALQWELYERTDSLLDLGLIGLVMAVPVFLFALPAGQTVDRYRSKTIVMLALATSALASVGLAIISYAHAPPFWVYPCLGLAGTSRAFAFPARWALLPRLVPIEAYGNAITWRSSGWQVAAVSGPALGGLALGFWGGAVPVYLFDVATTLAVLAMFAFVVEAPRPTQVEPITPDSMLAGARFVLGNELILATITLDMLGVLVGGSVAILPSFARDILHVGPSGLGWLRAAPAMGALVMALTLAHRPPLRRAGRSLLLAVAGFGVATVVFGLSKNYWLSLAMLALTGAFDNISVVVRGTLVQVLTPDRLRGRVSSVNSIFIDTSNQLGGFESGAAAQFLGPAMAVILGGVGTVAVVLGVAAKWPRLWGLGSLGDLSVLPDVPMPSPSETESPRLSLSEGEV